MHTISIIVSVAMSLAASSVVLPGMSYSLFAIIMLELCVFSCC